MIGLNLLWLLFSFLLLDGLLLFFDMLLFLDWRRLHSIELLVGRILLVLEHTKGALARAGVVPTLVLVIVEFIEDLVELVLCLACALLLVVLDRVFQVLDYHCLV